MSAKPPSPFDRYASRYHDLHASAIRASGEDPAYFARLKIEYLVRTTAASRMPAPLEILDFGCGIGGSLAPLRDGFPQARLTGIDASGDSIAIARAAHPDVDLKVAHGETLPIADATVDMAMASCVFHHIAPDERSRWADELHRVVRPGGGVFVFEHNPLNPLTRKVVRDCAFDADAVLLGMAETRRLLREAGFKDIKSDYLVFFPRMLSALRWLEPGLGWLPAGAQYVVHGVAE